MNQKMSDFEEPDLEDHFENERGSLNYLPNHSNAADSLFLKNSVTETACSASEISLLQPVPVDVIAERAFEENDEPLDATIVREATIESSIQRSYVLLSSDILAMPGVAEDWHDAAVALECGKPIKLHP